MRHAVKNFRRYSLLEHLVGLEEERRGNRQAEGPGEGETAPQCGELRTFRRERPVGLAFLGRERLDDACNRPSDQVLQAR